MIKSSSKPSSSPPSAGLGIELVRALIITLTAFAIQWLIWPYIPPHHWILLYPAVFLSARLGGLFSGLFSVCLSLGLIWIFLPVQSYETGYWLSAGIFALMGTLLSAVHQHSKNLTTQQNKSLLENQNRLDFVLQAAAAGMWEWNPKTNQVLWSETLWTLYGLAPGSVEPSFEAWRATVELEDIAHVLANLNAAVSAKRSVYLEWRVANQPADQRWLASRGSPVLDDQGNLLTYRGLVFDISAHKRTELALRDSEALLRSVIEGTTDAIYVKDLSGRYLMANAATSAFLGQTTQAILGQDDMHLFPLAEASSIREYEQEIMRTGQLKTFEEAVTTAGGEQTVFGTIKGPIYDGNGNVTGIFGIARDITLLKHTQSILSERESQLKLFVEHVPVAVAMFDQDMCYLTYSKRWLQDYGLPDDLTGRCHYNVFPEIPEHWREVHRQVLAGEVMRSDDDFFTRVNGVTQWQRWEMRPWFKPDGKIGGLIAFTEDITTRKQTEIALRAEIEARQAKESEAEQLHQLYAALSQINETLLLVKSHQDVFDRICRILVETAGVGLAWIGQLNPDTQRLLPVASFGDASNYLDDIVVYATADHPEGRGPTGTAFRENRTVICQDFSQSPMTIPWRNRAAKSGWNSAASIPIHLGDVVCGVLTLYSKDTFAFQQDQIALLEKAASNISFALAVIEKEDARQRAEAAIAINAERYARLLTTSQDGVLLTDASTLRLIDVNEAMCKISGYSKDELLSMRVSDLNAQFTAEELQNIVASIMASGWRMFETRHRTKTGQIIDMEVSVMPDANGKSLLAFLRDITARKQDEQLLRETKERLEAAASASIIGIWDWHAPDDKLFWDPVMYALYGLEADQFKGAYQAWAQAIHPADKAYVEGEIQAALRGERQYEPEFRVVWPDGSIHHIKAKSRTTFDDKGQPLRMLGINYDQTEQKLAAGLLEQRVAERTLQLKSSNQQLALTQFAMEQVGFGVYWVDAATGQLSQVNRCAASLLGYSMTELGTLCLSDIAPEYELIRIERNRIEWLESGHHTLETVHITKTGAIIPVEMVAFYSMDEDGSAYWVTFVIDTTQRKQQEHALLEAKHAAERANQAKSMFLSNMSHEIRTPMNAIIGYTRILKSDNLEPIQIERLQKIEASARHLLSIINDILDISKIEAGRVELETINFSLDALMADVCLLTADQASRKQLEVYIDEDHVPKWLKGDATRLRQALLNFAANAVKFTAKGSINLRCLLLGEDDEGLLLVRFEVQDTGPGIAETDLPRLFQDFEQADASTTRKFGGTGLSLAITRRLAQLMGGTVGVESELGRGSTFWFTVKLARGEEPAELPTGTVQTNANASVSALDELLKQQAGASVLLAEDDFFNQEVALQVLHAARLSVAIAANGQLALEKALTNSYDLILMDMQMPVMDGLEATRQIRTIPGLKKIPIIAMTANAFEEDRRACIEAGMNDFLTKPVDAETLYATLLKWLPVKPIGTLAPPPVPQETGHPLGQIEQLSAIAGLDVAAGLAVVNDNPAIYLRLMQLLVDSYSKELDSLHTLLASGDLEKLGKLAHKIKGSSGGIGAKRIHKLAVALDHAVHHNIHRDTTQQVCITLIDEMSKLCETVNTILTSPNDPMST